VTDSDNFIVEILNQTKLFSPLINLRYQAKIRKLISVQATTAGTLKIEFAAVVKIDEMVSMQAAYATVTKGLQEYNVNSTWANATSITSLTPTRFKNISREATEMAVFHDATGPTLCRMVYAMDYIQACDGVETDTFTYLDNHYIKVKYNGLLCQYENAILANWALDSGANKPE